MKLHHYHPPKTYHPPKPYQITDGHKNKAFAEIEEVELQHATNVTDTSAGVIGSSGNNGGVPHQSPP
jgi:hypothetical protein